ncbi:WXG100 family type VII secretion target [Nocardioides sp. CN2-186]|uniref:WXG100 family type VII secretion target n=1 Tax=Nocardioides tweenelious TaxID=3156607 RepID=UPI0032B329CD
MFAVDLDDLARSIDEMARCGGDLDALLAEITARVAVLHDTWSGAASSAQAAAQAEWETGFREMRAALAAMRAAADTAHGNYSAAAATNVRMWEQVR